MNVLVMAEKEVEEFVPDDSSPSDPVDEEAKDGRVNEMGDWGVDPELLELEREEGAEGSETLRGLTTSLAKRFVWAL